MPQSQSHPYYRIQTFGSLQIHGADETLLLKGEKTRNLLAYLVLHPRIAHRREVLADMLWPDAQQDRVRRNLSDVLYRLQRIIHPDWLISDDDTIALQPNANLWVDVWEFDSLVTGNSAEGLQKSIDLYKGELLPEIYEDWVLAERELRRSQYLSALELLAGKLEADGRLQQALQYARRLVLAEPLHEPAHQTYLRLLGRLRRFGEAFAHYDYLYGLLRSELDSRPMAETSAIVDAMVRERDLDSASPTEESRPFIGRKAERAAALTVVEAMLNGNGGLLTVEGEAGIGKSRFLREVASGARWRGATVLYGQASETPSASPFAPLIEALSPLLNGSRGKQLETLIASETLSMLAPLNPTWGAKSKGVDAPSDQAGKRFYNGLNLFGETLAKLTPTVLMFDDMHWADAVMWECLRALAMGFVQRGGLIVVAYRRPEIENQMSWEFIQGWDRDGILKTIALGPLNVEEVAQFIGDAADADPVEIHAWAGGNPFFINEWLAEPALERHTHRASISTRLQTLSPIAKSALESASVLGESIPYRLWSEASELTSPILASLCDELTAHHWLQPSTTGYEFAHDLIRSTIYHQIEPARRRGLHESAARAYLTFEPDNLRARAFHFDHAGLEADAAKAYRIAGEQDLARFAFREAQSAFARALTLTPVVDKIARAEIAITLTEVCHATGDRVREESALTEALNNAQNSEPHLLRALLNGGKFATHIGQIAEGEERLQRALSLARRLIDRTKETEALILLGILAREQSHWSEAKKYYSQALELARAIGDKLREAQSLTGLGYVIDDQGSPLEAIPWIEQSLDIYRALGSHWRTASAQAGFMAVLINLGVWDRVLAIAEEAVPVLEAFGDRPNAAVARHNQARAYQELGDYAAARQNLQRNLQVFESVQSRRALGVTQNVLGDIAEAEGNFEEALSFHRAAIANAETVNSLEGRAYAQQDVGELLIKVGKPWDAIPMLESAHALWKEQENSWEQLKSGTLLSLAYFAAGEGAQAEELVEESWSAYQSGIQMGEGSQSWLWALFQLLTNLEQHDSAHSVLRAAYAELQRQASAISNPELRRSFFNRVSLNRDIVAAHDQLAGISRVVTVKLARKDAPLGRSLREDDFVKVQWTANAPEDEAITDKTARRQFQLKRLLEQAEGQNAAPTDEDLAHTLGVSRRTILRDMKELAREIPKPPTRKRKK